MPRPNSNLVKMLSIRAIWAQNGSENGGSFFVTVQ